MGAQSSPGRVLGNLAPRERIGQCYPAGKDARIIHPCRMEQIDSVKINGDDDKMICITRKADFTGMLQSSSIFVSEVIFSNNFTKDLKYSQVIQKAMIFSFESAKTKITRITFLYFHEHLKASVLQTNKVQCPEPIFFPAPSVSHYLASHMNCCS